MSEDANPKAPVGTDPDAVRPQWPANMICLHDVRQPRARRYELMSEHGPTYMGGPLGQARTQDACLRASAAMAPRRRAGYEARQGPENLET